MAPPYAWSPDGRLIAGFSDGLRLCKEDGTFVREFQTGNSYEDIVFTPDATSVLMLGGGREDKVYRLNLASGEHTPLFTCSDTACQILAMSRDGKLVAVKEGRANVAIHETGKPRVLLRQTRPPFWGVGYRADTRTVAWGTRKNQKGYFAVEALERAFSFADLTWVDLGSQPYQRAKFAVADRSVVEAVEPSLDGTPPKPMDGVQVRQNGQDLEYHPIVDVEPVRVSFFGKDHLAMTSSGGLKLVNAVRWKQSHVLCSDRVWSLACSSDDRYLFAGCDDGVIRVFSRNNGGTLLLLFLPLDQDWIAWTPEGYYAASPGGEQLMGWHVNNGPDQLASYYPAARFRKTLYRPDVIKHLLETGSLDKALAAADQERGQSTPKTAVAQVLPPRVRITAPARSGERLTTSQLEVRASAHSTGEHPITALRLLLDGRPYQGDQGLQTLPTPKLGEVRMSWTVELPPGTHQLAVLAASAVSQGRSDPVEVTYAPAGKPVAAEGNLYVLAIGINAYAGRNRLDGAVADARAMDTLAQKQQGQGLYHRVHTRLLTDKEASRQGILQGLAWLKQHMRGNDLAVLFYAGHGILDKDERFYLLPVDVDVRNLARTGISEEELKAALAAIPGRVLVLLDCCHSGKVGLAGALGGKLTDNLQRDLNSDDYGVVTMCAAAKRQEADDRTEQGHSPFTTALLEGLGGQADYNRDGLVRLKELDNYVAERVRELTKDGQKAVSAIGPTTGSYAVSKP